MARPARYGGLSIALKAVTSSQNPTKEEVAAMPHVFDKYMPSEADSDATKRGKAALLHWGCLLVQPDRQAAMERDLLVSEAAYASSFRGPQRADTEFFDDPENEDWWGRLPDHPDFGVDTGIERVWPVDLTAAERMAAGLGRADDVMGRGEWIALALDLMGRSDERVAA